MRIAQRLAVDVPTFDKDGGVFLVQRAQRGRRFGEIGQHPVMTMRDRLAASVAKKGAVPEIAGFATVAGPLVRQ